MTKPVFVFLSCVLALASCSSAPKPVPDVVETPVPQVRPGTARWSGAALNLPKNSPLVVSLRFSELLGALRDGKDWLTREPAMFGEGGEDRVATIELYWSVVSGYLGSDPADSATWARQGLDVERPLYLGAYALSKSGESFTETVDATLRAEFGAPADADLLKALLSVRDGGSIDEGVNARVVRAVEGLRPVPALRVLVPTTDAPRLFNFIDGLAIGGGYIRLGPEETGPMELGPLGRAYFDPQSPLPAFSIRIDSDGYIAFDAVFEPFSAAAVTASDAATLRPLLVTDLTEILSSTKAGRPAAPHAPDQPSIAIGVDQASMAKLVKARGYRRTLDFLRMVSADKRDEVLVTGLLNTLVNAQSWDVRSGDLTGLSYSMKVGEASQVASFEMTIYGDHDAPMLDVSHSARGLNVGNRSLSFALDFDPFYTEPWRSWLHVSEPGQTLEMLDAVDDDLIFGFLAMPRNLALLVGNLAEATPESFNPTLAALMNVFPAVQRLEFVTIEPNLQDFFKRPRFVILALLRGDAEASTRQAAAGQLMNFAIGLSRNLRSTEVEKEPAVGALTPDTTVTYDDHGLPVSYRFVSSTESGGPFFIVGAGLQSDEIDTEIQRIFDEPIKGVDEVAFARVEPVALISLLTAVDAKAIAPLDAGILAQRLGVLTASVLPDRSKGVQRLRFRMQLAAPLKL